MEQINTAFREKKEIQPVSKPNNNGNGNRRNSVNLLAEMGETRV